VSITSTSHLSKELFNHKGAGTLIRRGLKIQEVKNTLDGLNLERLKKLLLTSPTYDPHFFDTIKKVPFSLYVDEEYQVVAVVVQEPGYSFLFLFLDKQKQTTEEKQQQQQQLSSRRSIPLLYQFHVLPEAQDFNFRENVWHRLRSSFPQLCWLTNRNDPEKPWFFSHSEGSFSEGEKSVFWYGLSNISDAKTCVEKLVQTGGKPFSSPLGQTRGYSTSSLGQRRAYSTTPKISKVGMLGARGYVGQEVIKVCSFPSLICNTR